MHNAMKKTELRLVRGPGRRDGWYEISPAQAAHLLASGGKNRPLKEVRARLLADAIEAGAWKENGETIIFDEDGVLMDGQHRLRACVLADRPIVSYCVFDVSSSFFASLDTGASRSGGDVAALLDFQNATSVAAIARLTTIYANGTVVNRMEDSRIMTNDQLGRFIAYYRNELNAAIMTVIKYRPGLTRLVPLSHMMFLNFMVSDKEKVEQFTDKMATGEGLVKGDALLLFRQKMLNLVGERHKLRQLDKLALLVKSWNAFVRNRPVGLLRWSSDEQFPKIELALKINLSAIDGD